MLDDVTGAAPEKSGALETAITVTGVPNGQIAVTIFPDENTVPSQLGGPQDLNFDARVHSPFGRQYQVVLRHNFGF